MTLELLCELLLGSGMKLLLERDWLKGGEPASHIVDDRYGLTYEERGLSQTHDAGQGGHDESMVGSRRGRQTVQ